MMRCLRSLHPLAAVASSGWRSRTAAGLVLAGLVAGPLHVHRADAHGTGEHIVKITGVMDIVDIDDVSDDERCSRPFAEEKKFQASARTPSVKFDITRECDEVEARVVATVTPRDDGSVDMIGFIRVVEHDCFVFCTTDTVGQRDFGTFTSEGRFQRFGPITVGEGRTDGRATFEYTIITFG